VTIDINKVCNIAKAAGQAILSVYDGDHAVEYKDDKSPLTAADKASHEVIIAGLQKHFPEIPILSEEGADIPYEERKGWSRFWCVDPLDGTKEFIKRNGEFTVNIALIEDGHPVAGVVYVPVQDKLYWGAVGEGAWVETESLKLTADSYSQAQEIRVREIDHEKGLTVVMSRSHPSPDLEAYLKNIKVAEAMPVGSSLKLCVVAEGLADIYPRLGPTMEWDTAAGHAVVEAAGGTVKQPNGEALVYNKENLLNPYFIVAGNRVS
jgi:3'(2'), 5'-bisphosphate nucleotidase